MASKDRSKQLAKIDRELAELQAEFSRIEASLPRRLRSGSTTKAKVTPPARSPKKRAKRTLPQPGPGSVNAPPPLAATDSSSSGAPQVNLPTGTDLSVPKEFGLMPPLDALVQGASTTEEYRQTLGREIATAATVLHTSGVVPAVWRAWRAFERRAQEQLRELGAPKVDRVNL